jgi:uncharacterized protein YkwD
MRRAVKLVILPFAGLLLLGTACAMPLPEEQIAATAQAQQHEQAQARARAGSGGEQSSSAGAISLAGTLSRDDEAVVADSGDAEETPEPEDATATTEAAAEPVRVTPAPEALQPENFAADALAALNALRTARGLPQLAFDGTLSAVANAYARYMGQANFFGHTGPDGSTPQSRLAGAGFGGTYKGEALSAGQASPSAALNALLSSPQHAAILLNGSSVAGAVGYYYAPNSTYKHYWVVLTANP